ncbi:hypothetical protein [Heyndrickxia coagulans]|uniref:hypothetical protein n=1 Tax=Heyndrickxia coagulans TaxID=1398 RepID=UPI0007796C1C|nr:hypothetical protein [Heyndrickxia coagulans]
MTQSLHNRTFRVGSNDYTIEMVNGLVRRHDLAGQVGYDDNVIKIDDALCKSRMHEVMVHELTHAMFEEAGYADDDKIGSEDEVNRLGKVLHGMLRDNDFGFIRGEDRGRPAEILDAFLQDIDTHLRATPDPLPYIRETMWRYWAYKEGMEHVDE